MRPNSPELDEARLRELSKAAEYAVDNRLRRNCECPWCREFTPSVDAALVREVLELRKHVADLSHDLDAAIKECNEHHGD